MPENQDLFKQLDAKHPDYLKWESNWKLFRDVLGDNEPELRDYLPRGELEDDKPYAIRLNLSEFIPESPIVISKLVNAVYSRGPVRQFNSSQIEDDFAKNVDLKGTIWDDFIENVCRRLLGYGTIRILVNVRRPDLLLQSSEQTLSVADEQDLGIRPYAINYSPLAVVDWETDQFGRLVMVRIKEEKKISSVTQVGQHDTLVRFIQYDEKNATWWEFRVTNEGREELMTPPDGNTSEHGLGVVPMIVENYPKEISSMVGAGFIRYIAKADKRKIQAESDLHYDTYMHAHPVFWYMGDDPKGTVGIGSSTYLKIKTGEKVGYVAMPESVSKNIREVIQLNIDSMHRHSGTDPLGVMTAGKGNVFQASGVSRAWSFGTSEARILKNIALKMQRIEILILDLVTRHLTPADQDLPRDESTFDGDIKYPEEFDPSSSVQLMESAEQSKEIVNSETFHKTLAKRIAATLAGGIKHETLESILKEIEDNPLPGEESQLDMRLPDIELSPEDDDDELPVRPPQNKNAPPPRRPARV